MFTQNCSKLELFSKYSKQKKLKLQRGSNNQSLISWLQFIRIPPCSPKGTNFTKKKHICRRGSNYNEMYTEQLLSITQNPSNILQWLSNWSDIFSNSFPTVFQQYSQIVFSNHLNCAFSFHRPACRFSISFATLKALCQRWKVLLLAIATLKATTLPEREPAEITAENIKKKLMWWST